jgi:hypothetical protein
MCVSIRVVNSGIPNDFGIPSLVNPEGLRDPENQSRNRPGSRDPEKVAVYLVTSVWIAGGLGGLNPSVVCPTPPPPNMMPWDTLGGQFQPPRWPLLMMLNRLCVMAMTMNRQMSTPHLFFYNSNPASHYCETISAKSRTNPGCRD